MRRAGIHGPASGPPGRGLGLSLDHQAAMPASPPRRLMVGELLDAARTLEHYAGMSRGIRRTFAGHGDAGTRVPVRELDRAISYPLVYEQGWGDSGEVEPSTSPFLRELPSGLVSVAVEEFVVDLEGLGQVEDASEIVDAAYVNRDTMDPASLSEGGGPRVQRRQL